MLLIFDELGQKGKDIIIILIMASIIGFDVPYNSEVQTNWKDWKMLGSSEGVEKGVEHSCSNGGIWNTTENHERVLRENRNSDQKTTIIYDVRFVPKISWIVRSIFDIIPQEENFHWLRLCVITE